MMEEKDKIELRSEKVRHIIGEVPPRIVSYGIVIITVVLVGLLAASYFVPYPETITGEAVVMDAKHIKVCLPYNSVNTVKKGMKANAAFEGFDAADYGYIKGCIADIDRAPKDDHGSNVFTAVLVVDKGEYRMIKGMKGSAGILVTNESILQRILNSFLFSKNV